MANAENFSLGELIDHFTVLIEEARSHNETYQALMNAVSELETLQLTRIKKRGDVADLFAAYKKILAVSMELRKLIQRFGVEVDTYNSVDYAIYFRGKISYANHLQLNWLRSNGSGLMLNLKAMTEDIQKDMSNEAQLKILELFQRHYEIYSEYVDAMYYQQDGHRHIGERGSNINMGHVAEAHERHLQDHHIDLYKMAKTSELQPSDILQQRLQTFERLNNSQQWHEPADIVWMHMHESLGYQRGTVAGDVASTQVKQARVTEKSANTTLRLSSIKNLRTGIQLYSEIFNDQKPAYEVAAKIAIYMSSVLDKDVSTALNKILQGLMKKDGDIGEALEKIKEVSNVTIYI